MSRKRKLQEPPVPYPQDKRLKIADQVSRLKLIHQISETEAFLAELKEELSKLPESNQDSKDIKDNKDDKHNKDNSETKDEERNVVQVSEDVKENNGNKDKDDETEEKDDGEERNEEEEQDNSESDDETEFLKRDDVRDLLQAYHFLRFEEQGGIRLEDRLWFAYGDYVDNSDTDSLMEQYHKALKDPVFMELWRQGQWKDD